MLRDNSINSTSLTNNSIYNTGNVHKNGLPRFSLFAKRKSKKFEEDRTITPMSHVLKILLDIFQVLIQVRAPDINILYIL